MRWPTTKDESDYLRVRQEQNIVRSANNPNENWAKGHLESLGIKWSRQALWGYRIFDFWNATLGIAVEIDGLEHNKDYDASRDAYNFDVSGIVVLRVRNQNMEDMAAALLQIGHSCYWWQRRESLGLKFSPKPPSRRQPCIPAWIGSYLPAVCDTLKAGLATKLSSKAVAKEQRNRSLAKTAKGGTPISDSQYKEMYLHEAQKNRLLAAEIKRLKACTTNPSFH
ncbi:MAG: DUF559 domain-containing protein [Janthinobacterium lividum]